MENLHRHSLFTVRARKVTSATRHLASASAELLWPTRCANCDAPGSVLCERCFEELPRIAYAAACPRCGAPYGYLVCTECIGEEWSFSEARAVGEFSGALARAIIVYKDAGERRLAAVLGNLLGEMIDEAYPAFADALVFVPATRKAIRKRGFDHMRDVAEVVSNRTGLPLVSPLARGRVADQRALGRTDRARNVAGSFRVRGKVKPNLILIDDVFTTGATVRAAASALLSSGALDVRVAVLARVW